jgi:hypothetical protein
VIESAKFMAEDQETPGVKEEAKDLFEKRRKGFFVREAKKARIEAGRVDIADTGKEYESDAGLNEQATRMVFGFVDRLGVDLEDLENKGRENSADYQRKSELRDRLAVVGFCAEEKRGDAPWLKDEEGREILTQMDVDVGLFMATELMMEEQTRNLPSSVRNSARKIREKKLGRAKKFGREIGEWKRKASGKDLEEIKDWEQMLQIRERYNQQFGDIPEELPAWRRKAGKIMRAAGRGAFMGLTERRIPVPEALMEPIPESRMSKIAVQTQGKEAAWVNVGLRWGREELDKRFKERLEAEGVVVEEEEERLEEVTAEEVVEEVEERVEEEKPRGVVLAKVPVEGVTASKSRTQELMDEGKSRKEAERIAVSEAEAKAYDQEMAEKEEEEEQLPEEEKKILGIGERLDVLRQAYELGTKFDTGNFKTQEDFVKAVGAALGLKSEEELELMKGAIVEAYRKNKTDFENLKKQKKHARIGLIMYLLLEMGAVVKDAIEEQLAQVAQQQ